MTEPGSTPPDSTPDEIGALLHEIQQLLDPRLDALEALILGLGPRLAALEPQLDSLGPKLDTLGTQVGELGPQVGGMRTGFTDLGDGLAGMRTDLRLLPEQVGGAVGGRLAETLETLRREITNTSAELAFLREATLADSPADPALATLEEQLDGLASRLDGLSLLQDEMLGLRTQVSELALGLPTGLDAGLEAVHTDVRLLDARFEALATLSARVGDLADIPGQLADVAAVLIALQESFEAPSSRDPRLDELVARLGADRGEDASLAPLGDLAVAVSIVSTSIASLSESVAMLTIDVAAVTQRLAEPTPTAPQPAGVADFADLTQPLLGEVASLRADFDNMRRLLLEEDPAEDGIDVTDSVRELIREEISQAVTNAVDAALAHAGVQQQQTETRLFNHVDEAVLALAEIVLQRR